MKLLVTGGAGFIGSSVIRSIIKNTDYEVVNVDSLTYAGNLCSIEDIFFNERHNFKNIDICNQIEIENILYESKPDAIMHLAAESHVDRSIKGPDQFIKTNVLGTYSLLEASRSYWSSLKLPKRHAFRFHHISTDEVFGDLGNTDGTFNEDSDYNPSSPYSASKAASDHLVSAWNRTYGLPTIISNCSNNYGPYQFPEKLIPLIITNAIKELPLPIYGDGKQIRDWLFVEDHADALLRIVKHANPGETYNIGGSNQMTNYDVVVSICSILDELAPKPSGKYSDLIEYVEDRPGHDFKYAIDATKISDELDWRPTETFSSGLYKTVKWYLDNESWVMGVLDGTYKNKYIELKKKL